jgi:hypothetical protein
MEKVRPNPHEILLNSEPKTLPQWWDYSEKFPGIEGEADTEHGRHRAFEIYSRIKQTVYALVRDERPVSKEHVQGVYNAMKADDELTLENVSAFAQRELTNGFDRTSRKKETTDWKIATKTQELLDETIREERVISPNGHDPLQNQ